MLFLKLTLLYVYNKSYTDITFLLTNDVIKKNSKLKYIVLKNRYSW